jgi:hypothetical protein
LTRVWARRSSRPPKPRDRRYSWAYLFGTVCPARGVGAGLVMPTVNVAAMNEHLKEIRRTVTPGAHCLLQVDGAGWHRPSPRLIVFDRSSGAEVHDTDSAVLGVWRLRWGRHRQTLFA